MSASRFISVHGAHVAGLDFSAPAIGAAGELAHRAGLAAEFVCADVHDAVTALGGRRFDVVYTGLGALNWLPDLQRWAQVVAQLLEPGGRFYLVEFHPFTDVFDDDDLSLTTSYFDRGPYNWTGPAHTPTQTRAPSTTAAWNGITHWATPSRR